MANTPPGVLPDIQPTIASSITPNPASNVPLNASDDDAEPRIHPPHRFPRGG
ncbi:hypothetical protein ABZ504_56525 [Streptomyces mirabilis]|uniref:hypothetical protein n=1 Tax=Streptomyces mirabilis TaxID=68239 RepID=UPI0033F86666